MKINSMVFAFSLLMISSEVLSYESYDFSPMEDNGYMSDDNYYDQGYRQPRYESERPRYKKSYSSYSRTKSDSAGDQQYIGGGKAFVFDPKQLRWYAFYNGNVVNTGRASGGRFYCPDIRRGCKTPVGVFSVNSKGGPDCKSSKYPVGKGNAPMPWCMFFHGGYAIHGSWSVPDYNASHGCIRVPPSDARWLSQNFLSTGTKVIVKSYR